MRTSSLILAAFLAGAAPALGPARAQVVSPLGGSTGSPQTPAPGISPAAPSATPSPAPTQGNAATPNRARKTYAERFAAANTTHDGKLTLEQARAGHMRSIVKNFAAIDTEKRGYVTFDQVTAYRAAHRTPRRPRTPAQ